MKKIIIALTVATTVLMSGCAGLSAWWNAEVCVGDNCGTVNGGFDNCAP